FVEAESDEAFAALINALNRSPLVELAEATPLPGPPTSADPEEALAFAAAMQEQDRLPWPDAARLRPQAPRTTTIAPIAATPSPPAAMMTDDEDADADARFAAGAVQSAAQGPMGFAVETPDPSAVVGDFTAQQTYRGPAPLG